MVFTWFDASQAKQFANEVADFLIEKMPKDAPNKKDNLLKKRADVIAIVLWKVDEFKNANKLNIYKKAQFGTVLKFRLSEAGFEPDFVDEITHVVLTSL